jgi:hypothetical protein
MHVKNRCGRKDPVLYPGGTPGGPPVYHPPVEYPGGTLGGPPVYHPSGDGLVNHPGG